MFCWETATSSPIIAVSLFTRHYRVLDLCLCIERDVTGERLMSRSSSLMLWIPIGALWWRQEPHVSDSRMHSLKWWTQIINSGIVNESVPTSWKCAVAIPLHKRGEPSQASNFRPITNVPTMCKIVGKLVHQQVTYISGSLLSVWWKPTRFLWRAIPLPRLF